MIRCVVSIEQKEVSRIVKMETRSYKVKMFGETKRKGSSFVKIEVISLEKVLNKVLFYYCAVKKTSLYKKHFLYFCIVLHSKPSALNRS